MGGFAGANPVPVRDSQGVLLLAENAYAGLTVSADGALQTTGFGTSPYQSFIASDKRVARRGKASVDLQTDRAAPGQVTGADYSAILSGQRNAIPARLTFDFDTFVPAHNVIAGGIGNRIGADDRANQGSFIGGGANNTIEGGSSSSGPTAVIGGGNNNTVSGAKGVIGGGEINTIGGSASYGVICGGYGNSIPEGYSAIVLGGSENIAQGNYSQAGGQRGKATKHGQRAFASEFFASLGDAQAADYNLMRVTTNATPAELYLDNGSFRLTLAQYQTLVFRALLGACTQGALSGGGHVAGWEVAGIISRGPSGAITFIGAPAITPMGASVGAAAWAISVSANSTFNALVFTVTGEAAKTIRWLATLRAAELTF